MSLIDRRVIVAPLITGVGAVAFARIGELGLALLSGGVCAMSIFLLLYEYVHQNRKKLRGMRKKRFEGE